MNEVKSEECMMHWRDPLDRMDELWRVRNFQKQEINGTRGSSSLRGRCYAAAFRVGYLAFIFGCCAGALSSRALDIQLPAEIGAFKQDVGAEIANGQCLICHSVEYVTTQPAMGRTFWKASVVKMQQKFGAPIAEAQVDTLVEYLTRNYGVATNSAAGATNTPAAHSAAASNQLTSSDGPQLAMKYGCFGCHNPTTKLIGPAYREIAAKYKTDAEAFSKIDLQIHKGGSGKWGPIIMPPFPQISPGETKVLAEWILALK